MSNLVLDMHELEKKVNNNNNNKNWYCENIENIKNIKKYHDIFAWKYHDTIMIYIVDIYH